MILPSSALELDEIQPSSVASRRKILLLSKVVYIGLKCYEPCGTEPSRQIQFGVGDRTISQLLRMDTASGNELISKGINDATVGFALRSVIMFSVIAELPADKLIEASTRSY